MLKAVKDGQMSQRKASETFGIPHSTLNNRINGNAYHSYPKEQDIFLIKLCNIYSFYK